MFDEIENFSLGRRIGKSELDMQHEAVELRFRQSKRSFVLDRILRRDHHEWIGQSARYARGGHLALGHGLEQRRLHLGRRAIDFIDKNQRMEHRSGREFEHAAILPPYRRSREIGGHEVRRALNSREADLQPAREKFRRAGFREAWRAFDEQMPVGEQTDQQSFDERGAANEARFQKVPELIEARVGVVFFVSGRRNGRVRPMHDGSFVDAFDALTSTVARMRPGSLGHVTGTIPSLVTKAMSLYWHSPSLP